MTLDDLGRAVLDLPDHLGLHAVLLAGLSLGGMVGMWLAIHAPERVDRLALLCTAPTCHRRRSGSTGPSGARGRHRAAISERWSSRWFTQAFAQTAARRRGGVTPRWSRHRPEGYAACCEVIAPMDLRDGWRRITAPTLVIAGAQDPATPPRATPSVIAAGIPDALLVTLDPAAHLANVEQPGAVTALLLDHVRAPGRRPR